MLPFRVKSQLQPLQHVPRNSFPANFPFSRNPFIICIYVFPARNSFVICIYKNTGGCTPL
jgi:hypothetical protein